MSKMQTCCPCFCQFCCQQPLTLPCEALPSQSDTRIPQQTAHEFSKFMNHSLFLKKNYGTKWINRALATTMYKLRVKSKI